jgi:hypothetical protein
MGSHGLLGILLCGSPLLLSGVFCMNGNDIPKAQAPGLFRTAELAYYFGVTPETILSWASERRFGLSPSAADCPNLLKYENARHHAPPNPMVDK